MIEVEIKNLSQLQQAIRNHPLHVVSNVQKYFVRAKALLQKTYMNNPWIVNGGGGGVPFATGNLRSKGTNVEMNTWYMSLFVDDRVDYGKYVHGNSEYPTQVSGKKIMTRPWLFHAYRSNADEIDKLQDKLVEDIVKEF